MWPGIGHDPRSGPHSHPVILARLCTERAAAAGIGVTAGAAEPQARSGSAVATRYRRSRLRYGGLPAHCGDWDVQFRVHGA